MNPGKLIDPVAVYEPTENLRIGAGYQPAQGEDLVPISRRQGSFSEATERCVGVGACRKQDHGTMCPSYMATREEKHSTRGRAHLLWEMMQGNVIQDGWRNEEVHEALELCLSCKACKTECPVNVDMATWKSEFLAHYYEGASASAASLRLRIHGSLGEHGLDCAFAGQSADGRMPGVNSLIKSCSAWRSSANFHGSPQRTSAINSTAHRNTAASGQPVLLWPDTWNNYFHPQALTVRRQTSHRRRNQRADPANGTSAAAGRSTTSASSTKRAATCCAFSTNLRRRSTPEFLSSCSNQAAPPSSATNSSTSSPTTSARFA